MPKILFIDKDYIVRFGLHHIMLENLPVDVLFNTVSDNIECQEWLSKNQCNLLIIGSVNMEINQLIKQVKTRDSQTRILIFTDTHYKDAMNILMTGVDGFIYQRTEVSEIILAVQTVLKGVAYFGRELTNEMAQQTLMSHKQRKKVNSLNKSKITSHTVLSKRQMDVVQGLIRGESIHVIAMNLGLSQSTVATHKSLAYKKLGVDSIVVLVERFYADINFLGKKGR